MRRIILLILIPLCLISCASNEWEFKSPDWLQGKWYGKELSTNDEFILFSENSIVRIYFLYYIENKQYRYIQYFYNEFSVNAGEIEEFNIDNRVYVIGFDVTRHDVGFKIFKYLNNETIQYYLGRVPFSKYKREKIREYIQDAEFICELKRMKVTDVENKYLEEEGDKKNDSKQ